MNENNQVEDPKTDITEDQLLADGWTKTGDKVVIFEKKLENRNPINSDPEDTDIKLIVHGYFNAWRLAVLLPNGGMLNFVANSMKELKGFEDRIDFYDCPY